MAHWSVQYCRRCHWRHDIEDACDPSRLAAADAARAADVAPGSFIADTPRVWSQERAPGSTVSEADLYFRAHARLR